MTARKAHTYIYAEKKTTTRFGAPSPWEPDQQSYCATSFQCAVKVYFSAQYRNTAELGLPKRTDCKEVGAYGRQRSSKRAKARTVSVCDSKTRQKDKSCKARHPDLTLCSVPTSNRSTLASLALDTKTTDWSASLSPVLHRPSPAFGEPRL